MCTLKDTMKLIITLFNQINFDKDYLLNNNIMRFYAFGSYLEIKRHFEIWEDYNFATKAFLHLWSISFHLNTIADLDHKKQNTRDLKTIHIASELLSSLLDNCMVYFYITVGFLD